MKQNHSQTELLAWGFSGLYRDVLHRHAQPLRLAITRYLGSVGTYYRYHHGEYLLTPRHQRDILDICAAFGYTEGLHFDHYKPWNGCSSGGNDDSSASYAGTCAPGTCGNPIKNNF